MRVGKRTSLDGTDEQGSVRQANEVVIPSQNSGSSHVETVWQWTGGKKARLHPLRVAVGEADALVKPTNSANENKLIATEVTHRTSLVVNKTQLPGTEGTNSVVPHPNEGAGERVEGSAGASLDCSGFGLQLNGGQLQVS